MSTSLPHLFNQIKLSRCVYLIIKLSTLIKSILHGKWTIVLFATLELAFWLLVVAWYFFFTLSLPVLHYDKLKMHNINYLNRKFFYSIFASRIFSAAHFHKCLPGACACIRFAFLFVFGSLLHCTFNFIDVKKIVFVCEKMRKMEKSSHIHKTNIEFVVIQNAHCTDINVTCVKLRQIDKQNGKMWKSRHARKKKNHVLSHITRFGAFHCYLFSLYLFIYFIYCLCCDVCIILTMTTKMKKKIIKSII